MKNNKYKCKITSTLKKFHKVIKFVFIFYGNYATNMICLYLIINKCV